MELLGMDKMRAKFEGAMKFKSKKEEAKGMEGSNKIRFPTVMAEGSATMGELEREM